MGQISESEWTLQVRGEWTMRDITERIGTWLGEVEFNAPLGAFVTM